MKRRLPNSIYNPITLYGLGISLGTFGIIVVFFLMDSLGYTSSPYLGLFTYMILPGLMMVGIFMVPVGIILERRRKRHGKERRYFTLDLNHPRYRLAVMVFILGTLFFVVIAATGTYQAYHYTESVEFCGEVCHTVMKPEFVAYQHSPHARVKCAECHIGTGAGWFAKAKVSGMYQVYSVIFDKYPRPIETPIKNLRPARETCEECHWPDKFDGQKKMTKIYYPRDTTLLEPWMIEMDLKIGGGHSELGPTEGIHWHMNTAQDVVYVALDEKRLSIPWIKSTDMNGDTRIFRSLDHDISDSELSKLERRNMDCIDCHNRPSHIYYPPFRTINDAMAVGHIDPSIPGFRQISAYAMTREHVSTPQALKDIPRLIRAEYKQRAPEVLSTQSVKLERNIKAILEIYKRNFFPEMKVDWREYPSHIGHMYNIGCFRCHDNRHVADDGTVLTTECSQCHDIIRQGPISNPSSDIDGMEFQHPTNIEGAWKVVSCSDCHLGN
jgi:nitrate/TMAO reductase-like tetraheme cytochrome c subunit